MATAAQLKAKFGTVEPPEHMVVLKAGALRAELRGGAIGSIFHDGVEVLRGISFLVRDENWGTCAVRIKGLSITKGKDRFTVTYNASAENLGAKLRYQVHISATTNHLEFHAVATPDKTFKTNRTGFVVLHPIASVAGKPLTITHCDGQKQRARFPKHISPGQPFFNIRALQHAPAPGLTAHVLMEGDKFEMEDQRNWSDASFKTYVCSLLDPWPYDLPAGKTFEQKITLTLKGQNKFAPMRPAAAKLQTRKLPEIGIAIAQHEARHALEHLGVLKQLAPRHLTCLLDGATDMTSACAAYARLSRDTKIPITLEIILPAKDSAMIELANVASVTQRAGLMPKRVMVTHTHDLKSFQPTDKRPWGPSYEEMAKAARHFFPDAKIGGGMMSYFTELNRKPPPRGVFDFITHSICPIVHDASDAAVLQTLESLPQIFASTKALIGKTPYHLGPTSIGARMNPYGAALAHNPRRKRMCLAPNDPRQFGTFAVDWNKGVIAAAAEAGLTSITLSNLTGPQGLIDAKGKKSPLFFYLAKLNRPSN